MSKETAILKLKSKNLVKILKIKHGKRNDPENVQKLIKENNEINNLLK